MCASYFSSARFIYKIVTTHSSCITVTASELVCHMGRRLCFTSLMLPLPFPAVWLWYNGCLDTCLWQSHQYQLDFQASKLRIAAVKGLFALHKPTDKSWSGMICLLHNGFARGLKPACLRQPNTKYVNAMKIKKK